MDTTSLATGLALVASVSCAAAAMRASRLIASGLWLAGTSAFLASALYLLDAPYVAAIELSVSAGLVAVLFVFTITTAGDHTNRAAPGASRWLAAGLTGIALTLLGVASFPGVQPTASIADRCRRLRRRRWRTADIWFPTVDINITLVYRPRNVTVRNYEQSHRLRVEEGFFMSVVVLMLMLLAFVVFDLSAARWGADSRRLHPQSHMPN
jgi:NADH:ubiquinone oxidoreductase subunit 6 (subunit J)